MSASKLFNCCHYKCVYSAHMKQTVIGVLNTNLTYLVKHETQVAVTQSPKHIKWPG